MQTEIRDGILAGISVLVTRPAHQADRLCQLIEAAGGRAVRFPVIDIEPPADPQALRTLLEDIAGYDLAIFVSANAVEFALAALGKQGLPSSLQRAAVGKATAKALASQGYPPQIVPAEPYNSEALLALPELHSVQGKQIIIFRGEGGRELLAETLTARGARVSYAECYRRLRPQPDLAPLLAVWHNNAPLVVVATSNEGLQNLFDMLAPQHTESLRATPLVVISKRAAVLAQSLGFKRQIEVAQSASDEAIMAALAHLRQLKG